MGDVPGREVWSSHEIARFVEVRGGLGEESFLDIFSNVGSTDRYFERGVTYLVFPTTEDGILFDDECSATQEWSSDLLAFRPTTAHPPVSGSALPGGVPLPLLAAGLAVAVAIAAGATLLRRRRSSEV